MALSVALAFKTMTLRPRARPALVVEILRTARAECATPRRAAWTIARLRAWSWPTLILVWRRPLVALAVVFLGHDGLSGAGDEQKSQSDCDAFFHDLAPRAKRPKGLRGTYAYSLAPATEPRLMGAKSR